MRYRKFKADNLFTGTEMLDSDFTLLTTEEGVIKGILPSHIAGEGVEFFPGLLSPGFVNCHCHLELSHLKGVIPENTGMVDFLLSVMGNRNFSPGIIQEAIAEAETYMIDRGIVAVGDICNTADTLLQKKLGNLYYHNFIEATGFVPASAEQRFQQVRDLFNRFAGQYQEPMASNSIVPHAPYSVSGALMNRIASFPGNQLLSIHHQESEAENEFIQEGKGDFLRLYQSLGIDLSFFHPPHSRSLPHILGYFHKNQSLILVHNVATQEEDFRFLRSQSETPRADLYWCLCPNANQYISQKMPPVDLLVSQGCQIVLGTDSLASNHQLDILEEIKTLQHHFPNLGTGTLLHWATLQGAKALQVDNLIGSFEKGKQPGIVWLKNMEGQHFGPSSSAHRIL